MRLRTIILGFESYRSFYFTIGLLVAVSATAGFGWGGTPLSLAGIVKPNGAVQIVEPDGSGCGGWHIMLDPLLRTRFVATNTASPSCRPSSRPQAGSYWNDEIVIGPSSFRIRTIAVDGKHVYVTGRYRQEKRGEVVSGILRWSARTGSWNVVSSTGNN